MQRINVAVVGAGVVGSSLISQLHEKHSRIADEFEIDIRVPKVLVRSKIAKRAVPEKSILFSDGDSLGQFEDIVTTNIDDVIDDKNIDLVVEVAGGIDDAFEIISSALSSSKSVVTANKALLALRGSELYALAQKNGVDLLFEAAVGGGVPIIRPIRESLAVEKIKSVRAILNGTTNFMLSQMTKEGKSYDHALLQAQELGYAEADPTADVEGHDAAAKIAIISLLASGVIAKEGDVETKGISSVSSNDIESAREHGYVVKLIATCEDKDENEIFLRVAPTFVSMSHPFANVHDGFNAVFVTGEKLGEVMFYGPGAGGEPTASAVLGDLIDASVNVSNKTKGAVVGYMFDKKIADPRAWKSKFFLGLQVKDLPGVLAEIARVLGEHEVSVEMVKQVGQGDTANLEFITHVVADGKIKDAAESLKELSCVESVLALYPILD